MLELTPVETFYQDTRFCSRQITATCYTCEKASQRQYSPLHLGDFNFIIEHIAGKENVVADALSRLHKINSESKEKNMPENLPRMSQLSVRQEQNAGEPKQNWTSRRFSNRRNQPRNFPTRNYRQPRKRKNHMWLIRNGLAYQRIGNCSESKQPQMVINTNG